MCVQHRVHLMRVEQGSLLRLLPRGSRGRGGLKVEKWVSVENVSLKDGNISLSAVSLSGIYFTMVLSPAGDALAYSDGANPEGPC